MKKGRAGVVEMPNDSDFVGAAIYTFDTALLDMPKATVEDLFVKINYRGDVCRVYADGKLVEDNFWNGKPFYVRAADLAGKKVEIKILPLQKTDKIYLQQAERDELEKSDKYLLFLDGIELYQRMTK
ncbi:MAG: beta-galactosidase, partial [Prevotellaceae bacterium]|nr:beta-galactosidase [Prevotellaceae bacterium]